VPIVLELDGYEVVIYHPPREHGPPHVHVFRAEHQVVIGLTPIAVLRTTRTMRSGQIVAAVRIVENNVDVLISEWEKIHD
jgi:hypothetical protein